MAKFQRGKRPQQPAPRALASAQSPGSEALSCLVSDDLSLTFSSYARYSLDVQNLEQGRLASSADEIIAAVSVYRGDLLPGFYDEWVGAERVRLADLFETLLMRLLTILEDEGRWEEVGEWANRWISLGGWPGRRVSVLNDRSCQPR